MTKKIRLSLGVALVALSSIIFLRLHDQDEVGIVHSNNIDKYLSLYSDKAITSNAKLTNPQFSHLAFEESVEESNDSQLASAIQTFKYFLRYFVPQDAHYEYGTWLWTPIPHITEQYAEDILDKARANGVNVIYLSLDSYLDIFVLPKSQEKNEQEREFTETLNKFIALAKARGIEVDAEGGWRNWAEPGNEYKALTLLSYVRKFNAEHENKFRGFQYDIEPYLSEEYERDPEKSLRNFLRLVEKTEYYLKEDPLRLAVVVPAFYDERDRSISPFSYQGRTASVFEHLLRILDRKDGSSLVVMSYRNFAEGSDGSIEISSNELRTARRGFHNTKIILAQETGEIEPEFITFFGREKIYFKDQTGLLVNAFDHNFSFGGLAIHYVNAMVELK